MPADDGDDDEEEDENYNDRQLWKLRRLKKRKNNGKDVSSLFTAFYQRHV